MTGQLHHGYTNHTTREGATVVKRYAGPDSGLRQSREEQALRAFHGRLPVPAVLGSAPGRLTTEFVPGHHGQDLVTAGLGSYVLLACGRLLARIQAIPTGHDTVVVHGDFGPNNILLSRDGATVTALLDWEWSGTGNPTTDLAWCEFIVRMHHPDSIDTLASLFDGYGDRPSWQVRQQAMLEGAARQLDFGERWPGAKHVDVWTERIAAIEHWSDLPR